MKDAGTKVLDRVRGEGRRSSSALMARLDALETAVDVGGDRLEPRSAAQARRVIDRTHERMTFGAENSIAAFAGATGSGKSSLLNAVTGTQVARVGARRPTTASPAGVVFDDTADELLDWLEVGTRHHLSTADIEGAAGLAGLVLLDLPDHDSTQTQHQVTVDRMVGLVDLLIWVVDPQKYADDVLHSRYLRNLVAHSGVMIVVLNQVDRLPPAQLDDVVADVRRLLAADGLPDVTVLGTSAVTGAGIDQLRAALVQVITRGEVMRARINADLDTCIEALRNSVGDREHTPDKLPGRDDLIDAFSGAAGVPVVLRAVGQDYTRRAVGATGWPFTRWMRRLRPDPMRRLRLDPANQAQQALRGRGQQPELEPSLARTSLPQASTAQRAQVDLALRSLSRQVGGDLPQRWAMAVRQTADPGQSEIADALDQAIAGVDLDYRRPLWWSLCGLAQILAALAVVGGLVWLIAIGVVGWLQLPELPMPRWEGFPYPTVMLVGGIAMGLGLALLARLLAGLGAARRRRIARRRLREAIGAVADSRVLRPVREVLEEHRLTRRALGVGS